MSHWPAIKTVKKSDRFLRDMVSALVICPDGNGRYWRVASITLRRGDWLAAHPQPMLIDLT
jgi:hypothetical protein